MPKISVSIVILVFLLAGCAIQPTSTTPDYQSYNCSQLGAELQLVNTKLNDVENQQVEDKIVGGTMSMLGYSVNSGPDDEMDVPSLHRRQDSLQHLMIAKNCYQQPSAVK